MEYVRKLGEGAYGEVWLVRDAGLDELRAAKLVTPSTIPDLSAYNEEARLLRELRHPNVIEVYGTVEGPHSGDTPDRDMYAIIMEYMEDGSLEDKLCDGLIPLEEAIHRISDACRGLERAHASNYVHRDVKPGNILLNGDRTKLSDFGLCTATNRGAASGAGTLCYIAPEVIRSGVTSKLSDVYSFGVTLCEAINGAQSVESALNESDLEDDILAGRFPDRRGFQPFVPKRIQRIINKAMNVKPEKRYQSIRDFRNALAREPIYCNWRLEADGEQEEWIGAGRGGLYRIVINHRIGSLDLSRSVNVEKLRRVNADCRRDLTPSELRAHQEEVMTRIVCQGY